MIVTMHFKQFQMPFLFQEYAFSGLVCHNSYFFYARTIFYLFKIFS